MSTADLVVGAVAALVVFGVGAPVLLVLRARSLVRASSAAIAHLGELNARYVESVMPLPALHLKFQHTAKSKVALERLNLVAFLGSCLLENEAWMRDQIAARQQRMSAYSRHSRELTNLGERLIGRSAHPRVKPAAYAQIERRLFQKQILATPRPIAVIVATAMYTSPKGQNRYSRQLEWNYDNLRVGLSAAQADRDRRTTTDYLRQRERTLMTPKVRTDILRRDDYRCRMCGASAADGVSLHIDHITPVSRGGRTTPDNLQTLCQTCNLGKSNRFVG